MVCTKRKAKFLPIVKKNHFCNQLYAKTVSNSNMSSIFCGIKDKRSFRKLKRVLFDPICDEMLQTCLGTITGFHVYPQK